jgi:hypothetical protein
VGRIQRFYLSLCVTYTFSVRPRNLRAHPHVHPDVHTRTVKNEHKQVAKEIEAVTSTIAGAADVQLPRLDARESDEGFFAPGGGVGALFIL